MSGSGGKPRSRWCPRARTPRREGTALRWDRRRFPHRHARGESLAYRVEVPAKVALLPDAFPSFSRAGGAPARRCHIPAAVGRRIGRRVRRATTAHAGGPAPVGRRHPALQRDARGGGGTDAARWRARSRYAFTDGAARQACRSSRSRSTRPAGAAGGTGASAPRSSTPRPCARAARGAARGDPRGDGAVDAAAVEAGSVSSSRASSCGSSASRRGAGRLSPGATSRFRRAARADRRRRTSCGGRAHRRHPAIDEVSGASATRACACARRTRGRFLRQGARRLFDALRARARRCLRWRRPGTRRLSRGRRWCTSR